MKVDNVKITSKAKSKEDFFKLMAVCHTVVIESVEGKKEIIYNASSPDELALVQGAAKMGYKLIGRTNSEIIISIFDEDIETYEFILEFPFNSVRKRMSIICKDCKSQNIILMTKGADSTMLPRIKFKKVSKKTVQEIIDKFSIEGLRTLVMGQKILKDEGFLFFLIKII